MTEQVILEALTGRIVDSKALTDALKNYCDYVSEIDTSNQYSLQTLTLGELKDALAEIQSSEVHIEEDLQLDDQDRVQLEENETVVTRFKYKKGKDKKGRTFARIERCSCIAIDFDDINFDRKLSVLAQAVLSRCNVRMPNGDVLTPIPVLSLSRVVSENTYRSDLVYRFCEGKDVDRTVINALVGLQDIAPDEIKNLIIMDLRLAPATLSKFARSHQTILGSYHDVAYKEKKAEETGYEAVNLSASVGNVTIVGEEHSIHENCFRFGKIEGSTETQASWDKKIFDQCKEDGILKEGVKAISANSLGISINASINTDNALIPEVISWPSYPNSSAGIKASCVEYVDDKEDTYIIVTFALIHQFVAASEFMVAYDQYLRQSVSFSRRKQVNIQNVSTVLGTYHFVAKAVFDDNGRLALKVPLTKASQESDSLCIDLRLMNCQSSKNIMCPSMILHAAPCFLNAPSTRAWSDGHVPFIAIEQGVVFLGGVLGEVEVDESQELSSYVLNSIKELSEQTGIPENQIIEQYRELPAYLPGEITGLRKKIRDKPGKAIATTFCETFTPFSQFVKHGTAKVLPSDKQQAITITDDKLFWVVSSTGELILTDVDQDIGQTARSAQITKTVVINDRLLWDKLFEMNGSDKYSKDKSKLFYVSNPTSWPIMQVIIEKGDYVILSKDQRPMNQGRYHKLTWDELENIPSFTRSGTSIYIHPTHTDDRYAFGKQHLTDSPLDRRFSDIMDRHKNLLDVTIQNPDLWSLPHEYIQAVFDKCRADSSLLECFCIVGINNSLLIPIKVLAEHANDPFSQPRDIIAIFNRKDLKYMPKSLRKRAVSRALFEIYQRFGVLLTKWEEWPTYENFVPEVMIEMEIKGSGFIKTAWSRYVNKMAYHKEFIAGMAIGQGSAVISEGLQYMPILRSILNVAMHLVAARQKTARSAAMAKSYFGIQNLIKKKSSFKEELIDGESLEERIAKKDTLQTMRHETLEGMFPHLTEEERSLGLLGLLLHHSKTDGTRTKSDCIGTVKKPAELKKNLKNLGWGDGADRQRNLTLLTNNYIEEELTDMDTTPDYIRAILDIEKNADKSESYQVPSIDTIIDEEGTIDEDNTVEGRAKVEFELGDGAPYIEVLQDYEDTLIEIKGEDATIIKGPKDEPDEGAAEMIIESFDELINDDDVSDIGEMYENEDEAMKAVENMGGEFLPEDISFDVKTGSNSSELETEPLHEEMTRTIEDQESVDRDLYNHQEVTAKITTLKELTDQRQGHLINSLEIDEATGISWVRSKKFKALVKLPKQWRYKNLNIPFETEQLVDNPPCYYPIIHGMEMSIPKLHNAMLTNNGLVSFLSCLHYYVETFGLTAIINTTANKMYTGCFAQCWNEDSRYIAVHAKSVISCVPKCNPRLGVYGKVPKFNRVIGVKFPVVVKDYQGLTKGTQAFWLNMIKVLKKARKPPNMHLCKLLFALGSICGKVCVHQDVASWLSGFFHLTPGQKYTTLEISNVADLYKLWKTGQYAYTEYEPSDRVYSVQLLKRREYTAPPICIIDSNMLIKQGKLNSADALIYSSEL